MQTKKKSILLMDSANCNENSYIRTYLGKKYYFSKYVARRVKSEHCLPILLAKTEVTMT